MSMITVFLIKTNFFDKPRYRVSENKVIEEIYSVYSEGVIEKEDKILQTYLLHEEIEARILKQAESKHRIFYRETNNELPWWKIFWGIGNDLNNKSTDAIVMLKICDRLFVVCHGHGRFLINSLAIEQDFGLRTALNLVNKDRIRQAGLFTPSDGGMQTRKQSGREVEIKQYDINVFNSLLKNIRGHVSKEFSKYFKNLEGADSLKFPFTESADELTNVLSQLLGFYKLENYKQNGFSWVDNFSIVRDKSLISILTSQLIDGINAKSSKAALSIPFPVNLGHDFCFQFKGPFIQSTGYFHDLDIERHYYSKIGTNSIDKDIFASHKIVFRDAELNHELETKKILECIYFETIYSGGHYFLESGVWYKVENTFVDQIETEISSLGLWESPLSYSERSILETLKDVEFKRKEYAYNGFLSKKLTEISRESALMDCAIVEYQDSKIELCDILCRENSGKYLLIHNKFNQGASALSHLFSQGNTSASLLTESNFRAEANKHIKGTSFLLPITPDLDRKSFVVIFGIITKKWKAGIGDLHLFSKINLSHFSKNIHRLGYEVMISFIPHE